MQVDLEEEDIWLQTQQDHVKGGGNGPLETRRETSGDPYHAKILTSDL